MGVEAATGMAIAEVGFSTVEESEKVSKTVFIPVEPVNTEDIIIVPNEVPATDDEDWNTPGCSKDPKNYAAVSLPTRILLIARPLIKSLLIHKVG
ncbi:unnamed protein product [Parnassius apollo]|uniref:(apollo) hypothetical protein n=1 Tax=Parnassius apollo TaxID=110799 RepID=A0A8S3WEX9_PARAO|nr:unnamed protein product [Parnassius apollo]